jgi:Asp/Glu/hydantoin racemase
MRKIAIIHTTPATVGPLKALAEEFIPGCEVANFVDDSILPQLARNGGDVTEVADRLVQYARFAEEVGAEAILSACSSVGELADLAQASVTVPVIRIDQAMAEESVRRGRTIGVAATLNTTLKPTIRLLQQMAGRAGVEVQIQPILVEAAYQRLMAGDPEGHDAILAEMLSQLAGEVDVVVLAQASMARVLPRLPESQQSKFLSSPRLAMRRV